MILQDLDLEELERLAEQTAGGWAENAFENLDTNGMLMHAHTHVCLKGHMRSNARAHKQTHAHARTEPVPKNPTAI